MKTEITNPGLLSKAGKCENFVLDCGTVRCAYTCKSRGKYFDPSKCFKDCPDFKEK